MYVLSNSNDQDQLQQLVHQKSIYKSLGAGLEYSSGEIGTFIEENGRFILTDINKSLDKLTFRYGEQADQKIEIYNSRDELISSLELSKQLNPGEQVNIVPADLISVFPERRE